MGVKSAGRERGVCRVWCREAFAAASAARPRPPPRHRQFAGGGAVLRGLTWFSILGFHTPYGEKRRGMHALPPNFLLSLSPARTRDLTHALSATATRPERRAFIAGGSGGDQGDGHTPPPPPPATTWERRRRACKNKRRGGSRVGKASGPTPAPTPSPPSITITPCLTVRLGVQKVGEVVDPPPPAPPAPQGSRREVSGARMGRGPCRPSQRGYMC